MKHLLTFLVILFLCPASSQAQTQLDSEARAINNYVIFSNESAHGMLIIHRLLELYNQEINKYVDLPQYQLNLFSNEDFPENIFQDESGSFYRISPSDLYAMAIKESAILPAKYATPANTIIGNMKAILDDLEKERYSIGTLIANTDLKQRSNLKNIYAALDACVLKYDEFESQRKQLSILLSKFSGEAKKNDAFNKSFVVPFNNYSTSLHLTFDALRRENTSSAVNSMSTLIKNAKTLKQALSIVDTKALNKQQASVLNELKTILDKQIGHVEAFSKNQSIPAEYDQYGPCYYFYNILLAGTTNKYGTGVIERGNEWIKINGRTFEYQFERPHFYKVIRPKEIIEEEKKVAVQEPPKVVENREIVADKSKLITSSVEKLLIEVYDNQEFDHDTISLNFNGTWILQKQLITKEPIRLYLTLEKGKDNYLILYADNLGSIPPNTCAIKWKNEKGKFNEIVLKSDYNTSEMVVIRRE